MGGRRYRWIGARARARENTQHTHKRRRSSHKMHRKHVYRRLFDFTSILCLQYFCEKSFFRFFPHFLYLFSFVGFCVVALVVWISVIFLSLLRRVCVRLSNSLKRGTSEVVWSYVSSNQSAMSGAHASMFSFVRFNWARRCCCSGAATASPGSFYCLENIWTKVGQRIERRLFCAQLRTRYNSQQRLFRFLHNGPI